MNIDLRFCLKEIKRKVKKQVIAAVVYILCV